MWLVVFRHGRAEFFCPAHAHGQLGEYPPASYAFLPGFTVQYSNSSAHQFGGPRCRKGGCYARPPH